MRKLSFLFIFILFLGLSYYISQPKEAHAETLNENIVNQLENLDLSKLDNLSKELNNEDATFTDTLYSIINGDYSTDYNNLFEYVREIALKKVLDFMPTLVTVIAIAVFASLIQSSKSIFAQEGVGSVINLVCYLTVILLLSSKIIYFFKNTKIIIENISKINEIMSPIILTMMIASGGSISASVYKPTVAFFTNSIVNIMLLVIFPLITLIMIFGIISVFSKDVKFNKFVDFFSSVIKWIIGITLGCFSLFLTVQGLSGAVHDGISIKAAKYAISNSIPLVGGFLRDGFDLTIAGSVLIKNAVGVSSMIVLINYILVPVIEIVIFSLILKLISAITESISDNKISQLCTFVSKTLSYLSVIILLTGFMLFLTILMMIFSANSFF